MAVMIPGEGPREHVAASREGLLYAALSRLPDSYYVVHSMDILSTTGGALRENEADFVVFHPDLGLMCIEAKAGRVSYSGGEWRYRDGSPMAHGGPYQQAAHNKRLIMDMARELNPSREIPSCKFLHAVWFPSVHRADMARVALPSESSLDITLFEDDLLDPEPSLRRIFALEVAGGVRTDLSERERKLMVERVLCPAFDIVPVTGLSYELAACVFAHLLDSQMRVLDFISDQRTAAINGAAGTGKTLIALEYARRMATRGDRVLFLCFNKMLKEDIARRAERIGAIDVYTIAGYACARCNAAVPDYESLSAQLDEDCGNGAFPYQHVVVDEGQDFGVEALDAADTLEYLREAVLSHGNGTFYLFYDKRQFVQGSKIPSVIDDADCRLTLYVNCRNTRQIAECSRRSISESGPLDVLEGSLASNPPMMFSSGDPAAQASYIEQEVGRLRDAGVRDVVILTCKTVRDSALEEWFTGSGDNLTWQGTKVPVTTVRKYKGLEADAVILVDVDGEIWKEPRMAYQPDPGLLFYTGASRARYELRVVCSMDEAGCERVLELLGRPSTRKPASKLAKALGCLQARLG